MFRNLMVTGVVSVVMGVTTLAFRSLAPQEAPRTMDGEAVQTGQTSGTPGTSAPTAGGLMGGGQAAGGMMMCPCMQMMMGGSMGGGMMGGQASGQAAATRPSSNPRTKEQAKELADQYLKSLGNPNLKVGEVRETAASYEAEVVTQDGSLVNRLIIDKKSGEVRTQY